MAVTPAQRSRAQCVCAADLRQRVELQACVATRDIIGGLVETWTTTATVWAQVRQASGRELWRRQQMQATAAWTISLRYRAELTTKHRVVYDGRTFEVRAVTDPDERRRFLELACEEIVAP
jgi:SPP1 family predicted phage head-tail adaptor